MMVRDLWAIVREAVSESVADRVPRLGAALAFYATFALAPLLLVVVAIAGIVFGREAAEGRLLGEIRELVGDKGGDALQAMVAAAGKQGSGILAGLAGSGVLLFGAIGLFGELQDALNTIWKVQLKPGQGVWGLIRSRLLSFALVLGVACLLLGSLVVSAVMAAMNGLLGGPPNNAIFDFISRLVSVAAITGLFAMLYRYLPDAVIAWRDVWFGAAVTAILFMLGNSIVGLYLGQTALTSVYGAAASFAVLLLWNYYTAQIFLLGAELTKTYAIRCGSGIAPAAHAELITFVARGQSSGAAAVTGDGKEKRADSARFL